MKPIQTEGIVLRVTDFQESDRIALFYTRDQGKVSALARHARKSRRRFGAQLNVFYLLQLQLKQKPHRSLALLERVRLVTPLSGIYQDWRRIAVACLVADLVNEMTREGNPNPRIYSACRDALLTLNHGGDWRTSLVHFQYRLLDAAGFRPAITTCVSCHKTWGRDESAYWIHSAGGAHCRNCLPQRVPFEILRSSRLAALQQVVTHADTEPYLGISPGGVDGATTADGVDDVLAAANLLYEFIRYQLGRPLKSWQFLEETGMLEVPRP